MQKHGKLIWVLLLQMAVFWPVWRWYFSRMTYSPEELPGLIGIFVALFLIWFNNRSFRIQEPGRKRAQCIPFVWLIVFNTIYFLTYPFSPPLIRAIIAVYGIGFTLTSYILGNGWHLGILGLFILGLPIIPTLQFYLGFPMRWFVGTVTVPLLNLSGFSVSLSGTCLDWCGKLIMIDAPCSGVKMLWSGLFLIFTLIGLYHTSFIQSTLAFIFTIAVILFGNILRSAALFYLEAGVIQAPPWAHEGFGLVSFFIAVCLIYLGFQRIRGNHLCTDILSI